MHKHTWRRVITLITWWQNEWSGRDKNEGPTQKPVHHRTILHDKRSRPDHFCIATIRLLPLRQCMPSKLKLTWDVIKSTYAVGKAIWCTGTLFKFSVPLIRKHICTKVNYICTLPRLYAGARVNSSTQNLIKVCARSAQGLVQVNKAKGKWLPYLLFKQWLKMKRGRCCCLRREQYFLAAAIVLSLCRFIPREHGPPCYWLPCLDSTPFNLWEKR